MYRSVGENLLDMSLAANWEDHDASTNPIINYYADRWHTELILKKQECFIASSCKDCLNCKKFYNYREEFKKKGFWTFNKKIKFWNVYDP